MMGVRAYLSEESLTLDAEHCSCNQSRSACGETAPLASRPSMLQRRIQDLVARHLARLGTREAPRRPGR